MRALPEDQGVPFLAQRFGFFLLVPLLLLLAGRVWAADPVVIEPSLDRNPIPMNESFTLTLSSSIEPDGEPDFSALLSHFEILNQSRGSSYKMVNGSIIRKYTWQLQLMAKEEGNLEIPPIPFGKDLSRPLSVSIVWGQGGRTRGPSSGSDGPGILVEMDASPKSPYVQAQVIVSVRVLSRMAFQGDLGQPEIPGILLEKLDPDRQFTTTRNGLQYRVDERRYALFPQKSGTLTIPPVDLTGEYVDPSNPFPRPGSRKFRLRSDPLNLEVRPIPAAFPGKNWLPASKLVLRETYKPDSASVAVGDALTRSLSLRAESSSSGVLPEIDGTAAEAAFKSYPDQPVLREEKGAAGLSGIREQKIALIPLQAGTYEVPEVTVPWWNTVDDRLEVARLPARTITVVPADPGVSKKTAEAETPPRQPAEPEPEPDSAVSPESPSNAPLIQNPWFWSTLAFLVLWLLTLAGFLRRRRQDRPPPSPAESQRPSASLGLAAIRKACKAQDARAAHEALVQLSLECWPNQSLEVRLAQLRSRLGAPMEQLERLLYAADGRVFDGQGLLDRVTALSWSPSSPSKTPSPLAPLNRL